MRPLGVKNVNHRFLGGKVVNRGLKMGAKGLGYIGDLTPLSMAFAPEIAPVLETAKLASVGLNALQKGRMMAKHRSVLA